MESEIKRIQEIWHKALNNPLNYRENGEVAYTLPIDDKSGYNGQIDGSGDNIERRYHKKRNKTPK